MGFWSNSRSSPGPKEGEAWRVRARAASLRVRLPVRLSKRGLRLVHRVLGDLTLELLQRWRPTSNCEGGQKADGRRRGSPTCGQVRVERPEVCSEGGEGARKADKRRMEGGSHRPISAPSMWIVCHEALLAGPVQRFELLPNPARRGLAEYRRWTNGGRKVEPTDQFRPPRWRFIGYEEFRADSAATAIRCDWGRTLAPAT